jgi:hypothetical protein
MKNTLLLIIILIVATQSCKKNNSGDPATTGTFYLNAKISGIQTNVDVPLKGISTDGYSCNARFGQDQVVNAPVQKSENYIGSEIVQSDYKKLTFVIKFYKIRSTNEMPTNSEMLPMLAPGEKTYSVKNATSGYWQTGIASIMMIKDVVSYRSTDSAQQAGSYFTVLSLDNLTNDATATKVIRVKFKCNMMSTNVGSHSISMEGEYRGRIVMK